jgi:DNA-binding transcriptional regulator YhcF (GntR family)
MLDLSIDRDSGIPVGVQLARRLRTAIELGQLAPGARLPSLREAADLSGANVNTVRAVYAKLAAAGVVATEQGRGTFVTDGPPPTDEATARRQLQAEIAQLEAELVALPIIPTEHPGGTTRRPGRPQLLSVDELAALRDLLSQRVGQLRAARGDIVRRLETGEPLAPAEPTPQRKPSSRSSSSLAGARVRWTGA